eukprot:418893-Amphidinium_carterae.1
MSSSSGSNMRVKTGEQIAAERSQRKKDKRQRQAEQRKAAAASLAKMAYVGSSDSDGFIQVEMGDVKSFADKASDDEIRRIERNLERLKAARKETVSTDSDQSAAGK